MITTAKIVRYINGQLLLEPSESIDRELLQKHVGTVEIRLNDGRRISADQRKKAFAIIRDIAIHTGYHPNLHQGLYEMGFHQ
jgi:hypothetical protein